MRCSLQCGVRPPGSRRGRGIEPRTRTLLHILSVLLLGVSACTGAGLDGPGTSEQTPTTPSTASRTLAPSTTTTTSPPTDGLPIDAAWTRDEIVWPITLACCGAPAIGPVSPDVPIPEYHEGQEETLPEDGFYDVTISRLGDPPGVIYMDMRRWVSCTDLPEACPPDSPEDGIVADPESEVARYMIFSDHELTVVIRPIQMYIDGQPPRATQVITGSGWDFYELLSGWCADNDRIGINCGVDHAFISWIWEPSQTGTSVEEIVAELVERGADPLFPIGLVDDGSTTIPCGPDRTCPLAFRGPLDTHLTVGSWESLDGTWPGARFYGWPAFLEMRDGRPILYIDAGAIAG